MARDRKPFRRRTRVTAVCAAALAIGASALAEVPASAASPPKGHDVSSHQKNVDWSGAKARGARFVYVKATESTNYRNPYFSQQYNGARTMRHHPRGVPLRAAEQVVGRDAGGVLRA